MLENIPAENQQCVDAVANVLNFEQREVEPSGQGTKRNGGQIGTGFCLFPCRLFDRSPCASIVYLLDDGGDRADADHDAYKCDVFNVVSQRSRSSRNEHSQLARSPFE